MPKQVSVAELQRQIEELETERGLFFNIVFTVEKVGWTQADYENHLQRLEWNQIINPVKPCISQFSRKTPVNGRNLAKNPENSWKNPEF